MSRLSMNELTTYRWSFEEDLHYYRRAGYQGVGVWLRKLHDFGVERGVELIEESGLEVSNVVWAGGFTGNDAAPAAENLVFARRALDTCQRLNAGSLVLYSGGRNGHTMRHAARLFCNAIDELLPHAEATGVPLAIEPMHGACAADWTFLVSLEKTAKLVESYDTPYLRMVYDSYHFPLHGSRLEMLERIAPLLAIVHLGDFDIPHGVDQARCQLGHGEAQLASVVQTLDAAGYDGFYDVELMGEAIEYSNYERLIAESRVAFEGMLSPTLSGAG